MSIKRNNKPIQCQEEIYNHRYHYPNKVCKKYVRKNIRGWQFVVVDCITIIDYFYANAMKRKSKWLEHNWNLKKNKFYFNLKYKILIEVINIIWVMVV